MASGQKWEIIRYVRSRESHQILDNVVTTIRQMTKEKVDIIPKPWQVNAIIDIIYKKKDVIILTGIGCGKSLPYQLISLIKESVIVFEIFPTIAFMTDQVYLPIITFYCKL